MYIYIFDDNLWNGFWVWKSWHKNGMMIKYVFETWANNIHATKEWKYKIWRTYFKYIAVALFYDNATRCREVVFKLANESKWKLLIILLKKIFWTSLNLKMFFGTVSRYFFTSASSFGHQGSTQIEEYYQLISSVLPTTPKNGQNQTWLWVYLSPFRP